MVMWKLSSLLLLLVVADQVHRYGVMSERKFGIADNADVPENEYHCTWYDECGKGTSGQPVNCFYNGTAKTLNDTNGLQILKKYCPLLYNGSHTKTCCSAQQLLTFSMNMDIPRQFLKRCPACFRNFINVFCFLTCHPHQSRFMSAASIRDSNLTTEGVVMSVNYAISESYGWGMFNSCKSVQMPSTNLKALKILCNADVDKCTPSIWLKYLGNPNNGKTPFQINFNLTNNPWHIKQYTLYPMETSIIPCNESVNSNSSVCSCQDCEATCPPHPIPPQSKPWEIMHIDAYAFIMGCLFIVFVILFMSYVICDNIVFQNSLGLDDGWVSRQKFTVRTSNTVPSCGIGYRLVRALENGFCCWGTFCAKHPVPVLVIGVIICIILSCGIILFKVITDPVELWSAPQNRARREKNYYDKHFMPFYRTEQLFITRAGNHSLLKHKNPPPDVGYSYFNPIFDKKFFHMLLDLQLEIQDLEAIYNNQTITLQDICFIPLAPDNNNCTIQSVLQYFQNSHINIDKVNTDGWFVYGDYLEHYESCVSSPTSILDPKVNQSCLALFGAPIDPNVVLGNLHDNDYKNVSAFVITFIINNYLDEEKNKPAEAWEKVFLDFIQNYNNSNMTIAYSAERSIQDELDRESKSDVITILISYMIMLAYISFALGQVHSFKRILVDSKITLGLGGVLIVFLSVLTSLGIFSYIGQPATLIIIEVVPFLVLAVGVDNIFILVQAFQRDIRKPDETLEKQVGRIVGQVGPSMMLTSLTESVAFFLGALTNMPAVKIFSLYAAMAVFCNFFLQITCFVGLMTLDARRQQANRFDIFCFIKLKKSNESKQDGCLYSLVKNYYSHFLMKNWVRPLVVLVFAFWFCVSLAMTFHIKVGLDQKLSMPEDSYLLNYFDNMSEYLSIGPPVYFVVEDGHNYTTHRGQNDICGSSGCHSDSLLGQVYLASLQSEYSFIAEGATSWLDDYFDWINPSGNPPCCRYHNNTGGFCKATDAGPCLPCKVKETHSRPNPESFMEYLPWFLLDNPEDKCTKGGHAAYGTAVEILENKTRVGATYFMSYHSVLKTSEEYVKALRNARLISDNVTSMLNTHGRYKVFPYSVFYVFYEQYLTIVNEAIFNLGMCFIAIFIVTFLLLGLDLYSAVMVVITIMMILVDILGMMYLWNITLNAVSLVNLVMAVGISVEFCSHITRSFAMSLSETRAMRAKDALAHMGSSVLSGITLTKLVGICVLAFAKSQLFKVFYFRMYLGIVLFGAGHGLIFLPVLLSYIGPPKRSMEDS